MPLVSPLSFLRSSPSLPPSLAHSQTHTLPVCRVAKASKNTLCLNQGYKLLSSKNRQVKIGRIWGIKHVASCAVERIFFSFFFLIHDNLIEAYYAFQFYSFPSERYVGSRACKSSPLSRGKHCSWNASSLVLPLITWLCDNTRRHRHVKYLHNLC